MPRSPLVNPYSGEDFDVLRAFEDHVEDHERRESQAGRIYTVHLTAVAATSTFIVIPRVTLEGYAFGRVSYTFTATLELDDTDYWTFTLQRYRMDSGSPTMRPIVGGEWTSSAIAMTKFKPYVVEFDQELDPGEVLALVVTKAAAAVAFTGSIQIQEIFGPEE